jgi:hypothetical protein
MNVITRLRVQARAAFHLRVSTLPGWLRSRVPGGPALLLIELDDLAAVGEQGASRPLEEWQGRVLDLFLAHGPVPVTLVSRPENALLGDLIRFCHRLDVPVTVRTTSAGLNAAAAMRMIDGGVRRVVVEQPSVDAFVALAEAREVRKAKVDLEAAATPSTSETEARAWVAAGADGVRVIAPWVNVPAEPWPLRDVVASFQRTPPEVWRGLKAMRSDGGEPGHVRSSGHCDVGARLVLDGEGARHCRWKSGRAGRDAPWKELAGQREAVQACDRECWHPEAR